MSGYSPLKITGMESGLIQSREQFILPDDAYPILENAFVWRERIKRRQGLEFLGRLQRNFTSFSLGATSGGQVTYTFADIYTTLGIDPTKEPNPQIAIGTVVINIAAPDAATFTDNGLGGFTVTGAGVSGTINYSTGAVTIVLTVAAGGGAITLNMGYYPDLPVMGLRSRELTSVVNEQTIAFDTRYAYFYNDSAYQELAPGTVWTGNDSNFVWSTNYWVDGANNRLFWVTNFSGPNGDPIRYYNGTVWTDFGPSATPTTGQIDVTGNFLTQALVLLPFRGRLVAFNTYEGKTLLTSLNYPQRIRWSQIGDPLITDGLGIPPKPGSWRSDVRGKGGFFDMPTSETITAVGFVRDNIVVYCERSTWQLRYTGRSISPFQIERVNSELGAASTFSAVQFDTSLVGIGDKGVVECDSYQSVRIDMKIPDLVFEFSNVNSGAERVHGIRDFQQKLAYWTYPYYPAEEEELGEEGTQGVYPNRRLVYNYENKSWAIFTDSITCFGTFQPSDSVTWAQATWTWGEANYPWVGKPALFPALIGGNQQGFVNYLGSNLTPLVSNDPTLFITSITGNTTTPTVITSPKHNLEDYQVISISGIPTGTPFANLNNPQEGNITAITQANPAQITSAAHGLSTGAMVEIDNVGGMTELNGNIYTITVNGANTFTLNGVNSTTFTAYTSGGTWTNQAINAFAVVTVDDNNFQLWKYNPVDGQFNIPQTDIPATYVGGGLISIRDGFSIISKKFNFLDEGQNIQMGYIDILMDSTDQGAITLNTYLNYNTDAPVNQNPQNSRNDTFFNKTIPTTQTQGISGSKYWHRVICPVRGAFITLEYTLSNAQLVGIEQQCDVQIDAQILWIRRSGRIQT